jgi:hypothetical protein
MLGEKPINVGLKISVFRGSLNHLEVVVLNRSFDMHRMTWGGALS